MTFYGNVDEPSLRMTHKKVETYGRPSVLIATT